MILVCFIILFTAPYWATAVGIPQELKVFPGMDLCLDLKPPLGLYDREGAEITGFFDTEELGTNTYLVNLFGWLPLTELVVDVVPLVEVFPGGQSIGVLLSSDGLIVNQIGAVRGIDGKDYFPARDGGIKPGDVLLAIEDRPLRRPESVSEIINALASEGRALNFTVRRGNKILNCQVKPIRTSQLDIFGQTNLTYMLGIYLEDPAAGVGTLSFYDQNTRRYAALGHTINNSLGRPIEIARGSIVEASIDSIRSGTRGSPGEKVGFFHGEQNVLGTIDSNTNFGIFGQLRGEFQHDSFTKPVPVAFCHQVETGPAEIYTVLKGNKVECFSVDIIKVSNQTKPSDKGLIIQVTDEYLLKETGGIIQGMSGSPILQNGMLVGAITHVFVNDPTKGYGSFAEWMIYEAGLVEELPTKQSVSREVFFYM